MASSTNPITFQNGLPPQEFFSAAWASEPLTAALQGTNIPFVLPGPDEDISIVAIRDGEVIGQCSANRAQKHWNHIEILDVNAQNTSTQVFARIHRLAVEVEIKYFLANGELEKSAFHSAGIAVLPGNRGEGLGVAMRERQIQVCREHGASFLFCETTNRYSAATVEQCGFVRLAQFQYALLAEMFNHPPLASIEDQFTVWCLRI